MIFIQIICTWDDLLLPGVFNKENCFDDNQNSNRLWNRYLIKRKKTQLNLNFFHFFQLASRNKETSPKLRKMNNGRTHLLKITSNLRYLHIKADELSRNTSRVDITIYVFMTYDRVMLKALVPAR